MSGIKDIIAEDFQLAAASALTRNKSLPDALSKYGTSSARLVRSCVKASTQCGCIGALEKGQPAGICDKCRGAVEKEMGDALFYLAGIANELGISIYDVMIEEKQRLELFKNYSLM